MTSKGLRITALLLLYFLVGCEGSVDQTLHQDSEINEDVDGIHLSLGFPRKELPRKLIRTPDLVSSITLRTKAFNNQNFLAFERFKKIKFLDISGTEISGSESSRIISQFSNLEVLCLSRTMVDPEILDAVNLEKVKRLFVASCNLRSENLHALQHADELSAIDVSYNDVSDCGIAYFRNLNKLEELDLSATSVSGSFIDSLTNCPLRVLNLRATKLEDKWIKKFGSLDSLQVLDLSANPQLSSESLVYLSQCHELINLNLSSTQIGDDALRHVTKIPFLQKLHLCGCKLSGDALVESLSECGNLEYVDLSGISLSRETIESIQKLSIQVVLDSFVPPLRND